MEDALLANETVLSPPIIRIYAKTKDSRVAVGSHKGNYVNSLSLWGRKGELTLLQLNTELLEPLQPIHECSNVR